MALFLQSREVHILGRICQALELSLLSDCLIPQTSSAELVHPSQPVSDTTLIYSGAEPFSYIGRDRHFSIHE